MRAAGTLRVGPLAFINLLQGRPHEAEIHARAMLTSKHNLNDNLGIALGLDLLTGANAAQGNGVEAARTSGTGHAYWLPGLLLPLVADFRELRGAAVRVAEQAAGDNAYDTAYHRALTDDAEHGLAHALQGTPSLTPPCETGLVSPVGR